MSQAAAKAPREWRDRCFEAFDVGDVRPRGADRRGEVEPDRLRAFTVLRRGAPEAAAAFPATAGVWSVG